ncbi:testis-expressed protein 9 isoform X2 [Diachasma alloeum]|uniref:testis-expressed protein 9 isoform X2 n=1 Tax=Diachasma alloeum TaxID=454923 RepID=UPI0007384358|nr:testis-expressed protein 9 isoform X2 [Diachasma alloeum]
MAEDLLSREKEFHRLNRELDEETKELMKEIDIVAQPKESFGASFTFKSRFSSAFDDFYAEYPLHNQPDENNEALTYPVESNSASILSPKPETSKNDAIIKILRKKIEVLTVENQATKDELKKKSNCIKDLEAENQRISAMKDKLYSQNNLQKESLAKMEAQINHLQTNAHEQTQENGFLKKEIDSLKKEWKSLTQQLHQLDLRLNRSLEENEKLRAAVKCSKIEEKELRSEMKKFKDNERNNMRKVQKQKTEILQAFKKQILLMDNLRKQKALLEVSKQVQLTQQDLSKILNWKGGVGDHNGPLG